MAGLTPTSFAILGWLEVQPWSTYELAQQMKRNVSFFWPRAESHLYEEPKNLVARGLATADLSYVGKRRRTTYQITEAGRQALREWHDRPVAAPTVEFEGLLRLFLGASGTPEQLLLALASARAYADGMQQAGRIVATDYLNGTYPFPQRAHLSGIVFDFLWQFSELLQNWAARSAEEISLWQDTAPDEEKQRRAFQLFLDSMSSRPPPSSTP